METKLGLIVGEGRIEPVRPMDAAPVHDHHDLLLRMAEDRHHLMNILAQILGIKVRHDFIEDFRGAIVGYVRDVCICRARDIHTYAASQIMPRKA